MQNICMGDLEEASPFGRSSSAHLLGKMNILGGISHELGVCSSIYPSEKKVDYRLI